MLVSEKQSDCRFVWYQNIRSPSFIFVTIRASDERTDRQTDGQNSDSNILRCITCSRTVIKPDDVRKHFPVLVSLLALPVSAAQYRTKRHMVVANIHKQVVFSNSALHFTLNCIPL